MSRLSLPLPIHKRVEYLSLAVGNAKSQLPSSTNKTGDSVQFLTNCEEKLEVAQVQIEIYRAIEESDLDPGRKADVRAQLEKGLYTISDVSLLLARMLRKPLTRVNGSSIPRLPNRWACWK